MKRNIMRAISGIFFSKRSESLQLCNFEFQMNYKENKMPVNGYVIIYLHLKLKTTTTKKKDTFFH